MNHFNNKQLDVILAQGPSDQDHAHLAACQACATRLEAARTELSALQGVDESLSALPGQFWDQQRRAILNRATEPRKKTWGVAVYAAWSAVAAALIVAGALMFPDQGAVAPKKGPQPATVDDALLLQSVDQTLQQYPEAYHPAQLMYSELDTASNKSQGSPRKDKGKQ
jgi:hypothetical protein